MRGQGIEHRPALQFSARSAWRSDGTETKPATVLATADTEYGEVPVYDEAKLDTIDRQFAVDVVVTHTAPSFCELTSHHFIHEWLDKDLLGDIRNERKVMDDIHAYLYAHSHPLRYWYYGHFHESWHSEIEGVKFNMLDIQELRELS